MYDSDNDGTDNTRQHFLDSLRFPLGMVLFLWLLHAYLTLVGSDPGWYGIMPRRLWGLKGIVTAPMVHGSWEHLLSNSFPLFVLSAITLYFFRKVAMRAFWMIFFLTGFAVWLLARPVLHIGASGIVYGLVAFIFWNGIFRRSLRSIILALIVMVFYSGMFLGILPDQEGISWESHLLGSLAGIFTSFWFKEEMEDDEVERYDPFADERGKEAEYFLPRDIFEKTKAQRAMEAEEEARHQQENNPPIWYRDWTL